MTIDIVRHLPSEANFYKHVLGSRTYYRRIDDSRIPLLPGTDALVESFSQAMADLYDSEGGDFLSLWRSDTVRTKLTLNALVSKLRADEYAITIDNRIREKEFGRWNGLDDPEREADDPELFKEYTADKYHVAPPDGESWRDVCDRAHAFLQRLFDVAELTGVTHFVVITHSVVKSVMMGALLGLNAEDIVAMPRPLNGSVDRYTGSRHCGRIESLYPRLRYCRTVAQPGFKRNTLSEFYRVASRSLHCLSLLPLASLLLRTKQTFR